MALYRPPSPGGARGNGGPVAVRAGLPPRQAAVRSPSPPGLRIMVAGVDKDARGSVEDSVRQGLGSRAEHGPWSVSVVSLAGKWSVTLDGPEDRLRGLSFVAERSGLVDAIREAVHGNGSAQASGASAPVAQAASVPVAQAGPPPAEARDQHDCEHCGKGVLVVYERRPDGARTLAAVACPHCWRIGHVEIDAWAAAGGEYRAEKG